MNALAEHLRLQLGAWPPTGPLVLAGSRCRTTPGWDGKIRPFAALTTPLGTVVSVSPEHVDAVEKLLPLWGTTDFDRHLADVLDPNGGRAVDMSAVYRWCETATAIDDAGEWVETADPRVPAWLRPFNGGVLCAWGENGDYIGGVGVKRHDEFACEIAVGTEPAARGRGLAKALVATAARAIAATGAMATYVHEPSNVASAHVAEAAGFPDRGWRLGGFWKPRTG